MKKSPQILLLQIREEKKVLKSELEGFARYSQLPLKNFHSLDVFKEKNFDLKIIQNFDALMIGGSSSASVLDPEKYPFVSHCQELLKEALQKKTPVFASCFGFQLAVLALGGTITRSKDRSFEMGCIDIKLTPEASQDPLFQNTPSVFKAVSVHREKCEKLPPNCQLLAYTEQCIHSFKVNGCPFWAFQFHPEVDLAELHFRLTLYIDKYGNTEQLNQVLKESSPTPASNKLLSNFVSYIQQRL